MADRTTLTKRLAPMCENELARNQWKGDAWDQAHPVDLSADVLYHAAKLDRAVRENDREAIAELAADTANCAAIVADRMDALDVALLPEPTGEEHQRPDYDDGPPVGGRRYGGRDLKELITVWQTEGAALPTRAAPTVDESNEVPF